jgi:hypothetical protein
VPTIATTTTTIAIAVAIAIATAIIATITLQPWGGQKVMLGGIITVSPRRVTAISTAISTLTPYLRETMKYEQSTLDLFIEFNVDMPIDGLNC